MSGPVDPVARAPRDSARFALWLTLAYLVVVAVGLVYHEMWRDELQPWMIARSSVSVPDMLHRMRYEGHPAAWYLALFVVARLTDDPLAMQLLHLALATGTAYVIARFAPFSRAGRALLVFGYFVCYEYGIINRSYILGALALFALCAAFPTRRRRYLLLAALLALLANTSAFGLILAAGFGAALLCEWAVDADLRRSLAARRWDVAGSVALAAAAAIASVAQMLPPSDALFTGKPAERVAAVDPAAIARTAALVWRAYVPIPRLEWLHFWGMDAFRTATTESLTLMPVLAAALVVAVLLLIARKPAVLCFYLVATGGLLLFAYSRFFGYMYHHGHLFLALVAALWLADLPTAEWRVPAAVDRLALAWQPWRRTYLGAVLLGQAGACAISYQAELRAPFSASKETATFLEQRGLATGPIAGCPEIVLSAVAGHLRRPLYYLDAGAFGTYVHYNRRHPSCSDGAHVRRELLTVATPSGPPVVVIFNKPLAIDTAGLAVVELARFTESVKGDERYYVYLVRRPARRCATPGREAASEDGRATAAASPASQDAPAYAAECSVE
jgi:hypothetical protein